MFRAIIKAYPSIICMRNQVGPVARCYVDFNAQIHPLCGAHAETGDESLMIRNVIDHTRELIRVAQPGEKTYLATDGVPPLAKMQQQRRRRFISALTVEATNPASKPWDRNAISPGTAFMAALSAAIKNDVKNDPIELWDDALHGEGEAKIFQHLRDDPTQETVVINGLDADLICLALVSPVQRIFLMREPVNFNMPSNEAFLYLNIDALRTGIERQGVDVKSYVTMCMLLGNDFLPALGPLRIKRGGIDVLMRALRKVSPPGSPTLVSNDGVLNTSVLQALLKEIEPVETKHMLELHRWYQNATPPPTTEPGALWEYFPILAKNKEVVDIFGRGDWRDNYRRLLFPGKRTPREAAECYMQGLQWNVSYYMNGYRSIDVAAWHYPYPYGPLAADLAVVAETTPTARYVAPQGTTEPFTPHECLLLILPPQSAGLLPTWARPIFTDPMRGCVHIYPTRFAFHSYLRQFMHEATPRLPPFDTECVLRQTRPTSQKKL